MDRRLTREAAPLVVPYAAAAVAAGAAWLWLWRVGGSGHLPAHGSAWLAFALGVAIWQSMIVAMMGPIVAPWVATYARLIAPAGDTAWIGAASSFAAGYFLVWLAYSVVATGLQLLLQRVGMFADGVVVRPLAGLVLVAAGAVQFLPLTRACVTHCRNPFSYLLARWHGGPPSGLRLGLVHGAFCLGCCWLIMLTGFAVGVMNLAWMAMLTVALAAQQRAPHGELLGRVFGAGLMALGLWLGVRS